MKINLTVIFFIILLFLQSVENFNIETRCTGTEPQGAYTFEIYATFSSARICIPGHTQNSGNCDNPGNFVELKEEHPFKGTATQALTCFSLLPDGGFYGTDIVPPHKENFNLFGNMWLATGVVEVSTRTKGWYFQMDGDHVNATRKENRWETVYEIDAGPQIFNHSLYAFKDMCSGTARVNVTDGIFTKGIRVCSRNGEANFCDDDSSIIEGMKYQAFNDFGQKEEKELSQCLISLPESTQCIGGGIRLLYNGEELAISRVGSFNINLEPQNALLCPGYIYEQEVQEPGFDGRSTYTVTLEIEVNENFEAELEIELQGQGQSSCQGNITKRSRVSFPRPQAEPQLTYVPVDNEKQLALASTLYPAEIIVKKDQETISQVLDGNLAIVLIHQNDSRLWVQAHSTFCNRYNTWETTIQGDSRDASGRISLTSVNRDSKLVWTSYRLGIQTVDMLMQGMTPDVRREGLTSIRLDTSTEYTLEYFNGNNNETMSFKTNPPELPQPKIDTRGRGKSCNLSISFEYTSFCQYGPSKNNLTSDPGYQVRTYGPNKTTTPVMNCSGTIFEWEYSTPAKSSYGSDQFQLSFNRTPGRCEALVSLENLEFNPWEKLSIAPMRFGRGVNFDHNLNAIIPLEEFSAGDSFVLSKRGCERHQKIKQFSLPQHLFAQWINKDIPVSYEWNDDCSRLEFSVTWNNEFYTGDPFFVVLEVDLKGNTNNTMILTEYAEKGEKTLEFFPQQFIPTINYRMDVRNCSDIVNIQFPWQQIEIESCDGSEPGESIPENVPEPPPPITRDRPVSRPIRRIWGDPHLQTIDGNTYSFNGVGEYVLVRSQNTTDDEPFFNIQVSLTEANQGSFKGSTISGVALQLDETVVEYNNEQEIYTNGQLNNNATMNSTISITGSPLTVSRYIDSDGNNAVDMEVPESEDVQPYETFLFRCVLSGGTISFAYSLPDYIFKNSEGLGGYWDGDDTNHFQLSNGTVFHGNMTEREAFHFGISWALSNIPGHPSSLFHSPSTEDPESYTPDFIEELNTKDISEKKKDACAQYSDPLEYKRCLFDVEATNNLEMANVGKQMKKVEEKTKKQQVEIPQSLEGIFATNITETSAFISWNNLRAEYRVAPYYTQKIEINLEPFDNDDAPVIQKTTPFDIDGTEVTLTSGTEYLLTAKLINEVGTSSSTPIRHFTTISSPQPDSSSSSSSDNSMSSSDHGDSSSSMSSSSMSRKESSSSGISSDDSDSENVSSSSSSNSNSNIHDSDSSESSSKTPDSSSSNDNDNSSSSSRDHDPSSSSSSENDENSTSSSSSHNMNPDSSSSRDEHSTESSSGISSNSTSESESESEIEDESSMSLASQRESIGVFVALINIIIFNVLMNLESI